MSLEEAAFVCSHIFYDTRPVLLVAREHGDWMYLCGCGHAQDEEYHVVGVKHLIKRDSTLLQVTDLEDNSEAERRFIGAEWIRIRLVPE